MKIEAVNPTYIKHISNHKDDTIMFTLVAKNTVTIAKNCTLNCKVHFNCILQPCLASLCHPPRYAPRVVWGKCFPKTLTTALLKPHGCEIVRPQFTCLTIVRCLLTIKTINFDLKYFKYVAFLDYFVVSCMPLFSVQTHS